MSGVQVAQGAVLRSFLASPASVIEARRIVEATALKWGCTPDTAHSAALLISEMVTNALTAAPYERLDLRVFRVAAWAGAGTVGPSPDLPVPRVPDFEAPGVFDPDADDPGGWGLGIIGSLAETSGCRPERGGKVVYAVLRTP